MPAPIPADEASRLRALHECETLDTPDEAAFDELTALAAQIAGTPMAMVSLVDETRQWFKSCIGVRARQTARDGAFCAYAILSDEPLIVEDATLDPRFAQSPLVTGEPFIRFYAGVPLVAPDGFRVGSFCVVDAKPRRLTDQQLSALRALAHQASSQLALRRAGRALREQARALDEARAAAENASAFKSDFLRGLGREVHEAINAITGFAALAAEERADAVLRREWLGTIRQRGAELQSLIDAALEFTSLESECVRPRPERIDPAWLVVFEIDSLRPWAESRGVRLTSSCEESLPPNLVLDPSVARRIVRSVIAAAVTMRGSSGTVDISAGLGSAAGSGRPALEVRVRMTGAVLKPEQIAGAFRPIGPISDDARLSGALGAEGFGLSFARALARRIGGEVGLSAGAPAGAEVVAHIPVEAPAQAGSPAPDADRCLVPASAGAK